jgi:hypothetical protein
MSRRARQHMTVELFPFLAVLVCVMGSLIFLLLVMTKRLRASAVAKALAAVQVVEDQQDAPLLPELAPEPDAPPVWSSADEPPRKLAAADLDHTRAPTVPPPSVVDYAAVEAEREALRNNWQTQVASLEQRRDDRQTAVNRQQLLARAAQQSIDELRHELLQRESELAQMMGRLSAVQDQLPRGARDRALLEQQIAALRQQLKQLESQQRDASGRYSIVPFDGKSGTTRRPLLIECTATGIRFLPEDVTLTPAEIEGFTPQYNPLAAGASALINYWSQPQFSAAGEPYVMLIVRPDGTLAYYIAMKLLSGTKRAYGYELVTNEMQLQVPPTDPQAKAALEEAIARVLMEREQILRGTRPGLGGGSGGGSGTRAGGTSGASTRIGGVSPGGRGTGNGNAPNTPREGSTFSMSDLEGGVGVGERSWQDIDRFEGQEHRRQRMPGSSTNSTTMAGTPDTSGTPQSARSTGSSVPRRLASEPSETWEPAGSRTGTLGVADRDAGMAAESPPPTAANGEPTAGTARDNRMISPDNEDASPLPDYRQDSSRRQGKPVAFTYDQLQRRKWGPHEPGASIGVERRVEIRVDAERLVIGNEISIPVRPGASRNEVFDQLLVRIDQLAQTWGQPGPGFFWIPSLRFVISPGGNTVYERIAPLVTKSGLSNSIEHTLERAAPATLEARP